MNRLKTAGGVVRDFIDRWVAVFVLAGLLALTGLGLIVLNLVAEQKTFAHEESVQRVHTIGERCETTAHTLTILQNNLPPSKHAEEDWFQGSYTHCLKSRAKVEARAGVKYKPGR
jgi:hypothetical protein